MPDNDQERWDEVCDLVHGDLAQRLTTFDGSMLTKYVAAVEAIDGATGQRALFLMCSNGTKPWESLGMFEFGKQVEQAASSREHGDE